MKRLPTPTASPTPPAVRPSRRPAARRAAHCPPSTDGGTDHVATLTIAANGGTYDGTTAYGATITDANSIQGDAKVQYQKKTDGSYGTATETAPKDAGDYKASITVSGATASVEYTIAKADSTANAPTGLTATYGQTLANVSLEGKNPEGNTPGTWAWADAATTSVGSVGAHTFKANFTPTDTTNYNSKSNVDVTVTVGKADPTAPTGLTATYGQTLANVTLPDGWTWADSTQSVGNVVDPAATFKANFTGNDNYNAATNVDVTVTVGKANAVAATVKDGEAVEAIAVLSAFEAVAVPSDTFTFKKVWEGGAEKSIDFTLYKADGSVYHHGFDKKTVSRREWRYNAWFSAPAACYVIEEPVEGYITRYENVGVYADITDRCCDGGTIVNKKIPKTGDSAPLALWAGMIALGAAGLGAARALGRRGKAGNTILNLKSYHLWVSFPSWRCFIPVNVALLRLPPFSLARAKNPSQI